VTNKTRQPQPCEFCGTPTTNQEWVRLEDGSSATVIECHDTDACDARMMARAEAAEAARRAEADAAFLRALADPSDPNAEALVAALRRGRTEEATTDTTAPMPTEAA